MVVLEATPPWTLNVVISCDSISRSGVLNGAIYLNVLGLLGFFY